MKNLHLFSLFMGAMVSLSMAAESYEIAGTVTKKGGGPLSGVKVLLKSNNHSEVTKDDGKFLFKSTGVINSKTAKAQPFSFKLSGNSVKFVSSEKIVSGNLSIFSANGKRVGSVDLSNSNLVSGQITLPRLASGLNTIRATVNNNVQTCQVIKMGNECHFVNKNTVSRLNSVSLLSKSLAAVDTLVATKDNFKETVVAIESYEVDNLSIEMDSIVGSNGAIAWGKKENPTADCKVGTLPEYSQLKANSKLPDTFKKLDGKRVASISDWAYRREEINQQLQKYIFGKKPIPSADAVSGTVSDSKITVKVSEGGKSCTFTATVKMNGATKPAPAIIRYGSVFGASGAAASSGVAEIVMEAIEGSGGSGAKTGPFYNLYGSNHEAGYLIAQAWQVSRIIDVLEKNPGTIDPYRVAVTGCSRNGKGAFIAGVLDNRIALTIPVESGIGGSVALQLVEKLDTRGEWPYHAISYVRWLSEVALGKFTSGNSAGADNTDRLPVDMHDAMAMIAPRGLYIVDSPSSNGLDPRSSWVTANVGKMIFEALGVGDNLSYQGSSGSHCQWRSQYTPPLNAMVNKFLRGDKSAKTGTVVTDLGSKPDPKNYCDWTAPKIEGSFGE